MKALIVIATLVVAVVLLRAMILRVLGRLPPDNCTMLIRIANGRCEVKRGVIDATARRQVAEVIGDAGVQSGFIAVADGRVRFSSSIPDSHHQRLRNVILNS